MSRARHVTSIREQVLQQNRHAFDKHVVRCEGAGRWLFAEPGTGCFHFRVIAAPRAVVVYGDIGDVIFIPSDRNALGWLRSVLRGKPGEYDVAYLAEKVPHRESITEFQPLLLERWIAERREELELERSEYVAGLSDGCDDESGGAAPIDFDDDDELERIRDQLDALDSLNTDPGSADVAYADIHDNVDDVDELPDLRGLTFHFMLQLFGLQRFCAALDAIDAAAEQSLDCAGL